MASARNLSNRDELCEALSFQVRQKTVSYSEMVRSFARKGIPVEGVMALRRTSPKPEPVVCITPVPLAISTPEKYRAPDALTMQIRDYMEGSFSSGAWIKTAQTRSCYSIKGKKRDATYSATDMDGSLSRCSEAYDILDLNPTEEAGMVSGSASDNFRQILFLEEPKTLIYVIDNLIDLSVNGRADVALASTRMMAAVGESTLGAYHPLSKIANYLCRLNRLELAELGLPCIQAMPTFSKANWDLCTGRQRLHVDIPKE